MEDGQLGGEKRGGCKDDQRRRKRLHEATANRNPLIMGGVLIMVGMALFAASGRLAEMFTDDSEE